MGKSKEQVIMEWMLRQGYCVYYVPFDTDEKKLNKVKVNEYTTLNLITTDEEMAKPAVIEGDRYKIMEDNVAYLKQRRYLDADKVKFYTSTKNPIYKYAYENNMDILTMDQWYMLNKYLNFGSNDCVLPLNHARRIIDILWEGENIDVLDCVPNYSNIYFDWMKGPFDDRPLMEKIFNTKLSEATIGKLSTVFLDIITYNMRYSIGDILKSIYVFKEKIADRECYDIRRNGCIQTYQEDKFVVTDRFGKYDQEAFMEMIDGYCIEEVEPRCEEATSSYKLDPISFGRENLYIDVKHVIDDILQTEYSVYLIPKEVLKYNTIRKDRQNKKEKN